MKNTKDFRASLMKSLNDPAEAAEYLNAARGEEDISFLLTALRDVAEAQGGLSALHRKTHLNRSNLHQMLSDHGNPRIRTFENVLKTYGLRIGVLADRRGRHSAAA